MHSNDFKADNPLLDTNDYPRKLTHLKKNCRKRRVGGKCLYSSPSVRLSCLKDEKYPTVVFFSNEIGELLLLSNSFSRDRSWSWWFQEWMSLHMDSPPLMEPNIHGKAHADAPECLGKRREREYNSNLHKPIAIKYPCNQFHACGSSFHGVIRHTLSEKNSQVI